MSLSVISYGGGVQSTAMIILATQGQIDAKTALFANVGDDSEHPATLRYVREVMTPWAAERGVEVIELRRAIRSRGETTLLTELLRPESRSIPIPVRMSNGRPGTRNCTANFKLKVLGRWLKAHGAGPDTPATVHVGISWDEIERVGNRQVTGYDTVHYPLIDRRWTRERCKAEIKDAGLPVPPKSSCWFCPFHRPSQWQELRRTDADLFAQAVRLERTLNDRRTMLGKDHVWFTRFARPLDEAIPEDRQFSLDYGGPGETCDEGVCWV
jgi:3'-phosphoadenosine 5'-phosphosulfate sulfotransferase (PAPS reductase)/FAD synthetase